MSLFCFLFFSVFRRGSAIVGTDPGAGEFWQAYLDFEKEGGTSNFAYILEVYIRLMSCPLEKLEAYQETFQQLGMSRPNTELQAAAFAIKIPTQDWESSPSMLPEGKTFEEVEAERGRPPAEIPDRAVLMMEFHAIFQKTKDLRQKIAPFLPQLQRPYFHVKPMEEHELESWRLFLAYVTTPEVGSLPQVPNKRPGCRSHLKVQGWNMPLSYPETIKVFERALVPCALYADIWQLYTNFVEEYDVEAAHEVHLRAIKFIKNNKTTFLNAAIFEERVGNFDVARKVYGEAVGRGLDSVDLIINFVNLERRRATSPRSVARVYDEILLHFILRKGSLESYCLLVMHYARYWQESGPEEEGEKWAKCRQLYVNAVSVALERPSLTSSFPVLYLDFIHFETHNPITPVNSKYEKVRELYERALSHAFKTLFPEASIRSLWDNYVAFVEDRGSSIEDVLAVKQRATAASLKKRKNENTQSVSNDATKAQKQQDPTAMYNVPAATTPGYNPYDPATAAYMAQMQQMMYGYGYS